MTMNTIQISKEVYAKIFLHACKYIDLPILGYLIGKSTDKLEVFNILPICHSYPAGPILDICGDFANKNLLQVPGSKIIGIYYGSGIITENSIIDSNDEVYIERIKQNIHELVGECYCLQVDNKVLAHATADDHLFLQATSYKRNTLLTCTVKDNIKQSTINDYLSTLLTKNIQFKFYDFEDYMNNITAITSNDQSSNDNLTPSYDFTNTFIDNINI